MLLSRYNQDIYSLRARHGVKDSNKVRGSVVAVRNHMGNVK